jgi:NADH:ubiquinone oxidoreductase subunit E
MPEIYDERRDPNAYRRAGLAARPMRNPARWDEAIDTPLVDEIIDGYGGRPEALVAILSAVQDRYGYLPERALRRVSDRMSIHWAQVFGAAGLGGFRLLPASGHVISVCDCASCRFAGGREVLRALEDELGIRAGETTADGSVSLETRNDVGAGAISPAIRIDTLVYGPVDADKALHIVDERRRASARGVGATARAVS